MRACRLSFPPAFRPLHPSSASSVNQIWATGEVTFASFRQIVLASYYAVTFYSTNISLHVFCEQKAHVSRINRKAGKMQKITDTEKKKKPAVTTYCQREMGCWRGGGGGGGCTGTTDGWTEYRLNLI